MSVPTDSTGKPLVKITASVQELIKTADYCNVQVGPFVVERYVEDENLIDKIKALYEEVDTALQEKRTEVIESI